MSDLIDRQKAIERINKQREHLRPNIYPQDEIGDAAYRICAEFIERLPSAQPKIIHCGDCRYKDDGIDEDGIPFLKCLNGRSYGGTRINDFCSWAERRNDDN